VAEESRETAAHPNLLAVEKLSANAFLLENKKIIFFSIKSVRFAKI